MPDQTARLTLPLLDPGQSQKEMTHNEALALIDAALQPSVRGVCTDDPPTAPGPGDQWIVGPHPTGAWTGFAQAIAVWTTGGWRFVAPVDGMAAWSIADALPIRFTEGEWVLGDLAATRLVIGGRPVVGPQCTAVATPAGGSVVDAEARVGIAAILAALRSHGLIASG